MKPKKGQPLEPVPMPLRDKLKIWAWIVGVFLFTGVCLHFVITHQQANSLNREIHRWRTDYHLNDEQARRIRTIEEEFHRIGSSFFRPAHTREEMREHHRAMADVMHPADGERFFKAQEGSAAPH